MPVHKESKGDRVKRLTDKLIAAAHPCFEKYWGGEYRNSMMLNMGDQRKNPSKRASEFAGSIMDASDMAGPDPCKSFLWQRRRIRKADLITYMK